MNDRELISALMDGELDVAEQARALDLLQQDAALAESWRRWQLIRASLQHEADDAADLSATVAARLIHEPSLESGPAVVPRRPLGRVFATHRLMAVVAMAACLVLAVALWLVPAPPSGGGDFSSLYAVSPKQTLITAPVAESPAAVDAVQRENAYIVMHSEYAHRDLQSGLRNFTRLAMADEEVVPSMAGEKL